MFKRILIKISFLVVVSSGFIQAQMFDDLIAQVQGAYNQVDAVTQAGIQQYIAIKGYEQLNYEYQQFSSQNPGLSFEKFIYYRMLEDNGADLHALAAQQRGYQAINQAQFEANRAAWADVNTAREDYWNSWYGWQSIIDERNAQVNYALRGQVVNVNPHTGQRILLPNWVPTGNYGQYSFNGQLWFINSPTGMSTPLTALPYGAGW